MEIWIDRLETVHIMPNLVDTDPFHGGGLALPVSRVEITAAIASSQNFHKNRTSSVPAMKPSETAQHLG